MQEGLHCVSGKPDLTFLQDSKNIHCMKSGEIMRSQPSSNTQTTNQADWKAAEHIQENLNR